MIFRKLFREPGPPRPRPWEPGREPPPILLTDWAPHLPTSSGPARPGSPGVAPVDQPLPRRYAEHRHYAEHLNPLHQRAQSATLYPPFDSLDDQIYPGLHLRPQAIQEIVNSPALPNERLTSFLHGASSPPPLNAKGQRSTWKKRLNFTKRTGEEDSRRLQTSVDTHSELKPSLEPRNALQRAVDALKKKKRVQNKHSGSFDVDLISSARPSYLPDQESLQQRAKGYRGSLDSHFDSLRSSQRRQAAASSGNRVEQLRAEHAAGSTAQHQQGFEPDFRGAGAPTLSTKPHLGATINSMPVPDHLTLGRSRASPLLPLKLHPPTTWPQQRVVSNQEKQLPKEPQTLTSPQIMPANSLIRQPILLHRPRTEPQVNASEEEWRQVRDKAIRKCEDWVVRSSEDVPLQRAQATTAAQKATDQDTVKTRKGPSTTVDSEALHDKLAQLLKDEDFRAAKGEQRDPVSSHEKRAVYKAKGEAKKGSDLARVFAQDERYRKHQLPAPAEDVAFRQAAPSSPVPPIPSKRAPAGPLNKNQDSSIPSRRGFAEKMFADAAIDPSPRGDLASGGDRALASTQLSPESPSLGMHVEIPQMERARPLPEKPASNPLMAAAHNGVKFGEIRSFSPDALMMVSPAYDRHLRSFNWGSLGPPTHLAEQQDNDTDPYRSSMQRAKKELEAEKLVEVMPQFGRSADLNLSITPSYVDSAAVVDESKEHPRYSLSGSQVEIINRIHNWRTKSGPEVSSDLYAASADATEPSAFFRGTKDDQDSCRLTSISRRAHAKLDDESNRKGNAGIAKGKKREETYPSDHSTIICADPGGDQQGKRVRHPLKVRLPNVSPRAKPTTDLKMGKLIDVASPPLSPPLGNGTKHIRELTSDESRKLFELIDQGHERSTPDPHAASVHVQEQTSGRDIEEASLIQPRTDRLQRWQELLHDLAHDLNDDTDSTIETLLNQYSEEMKQFFKSNPEMLLFVSLRAKMIAAAKQQDSSKEEKEIDTTSIAHPRLLDNTTSSTQANCSFNTEAVSFWLGDEKQLERALQKIIDYVENAGEITQVQKSLLELHKSLLDRSNYTATIDRRLSLLEQAVYTQR